MLRSSETSVRMPTDTRRATRGTRPIALRFTCSSDTRDIPCSLETWSQVNTLSFTPLTTLTQQWNCMNAFSFLTLFNDTSPTARAVHRHILRSLWTMNYEGLGSKRPWPILYNRLKGRDRITKRWKISETITESGTSRLSRSSANHYTVIFFRYEWKWFNLVIRRRLRCFIMSKGEKSLLGPKYRWNSSMGCEVVNWFSVANAGISWTRLSGS